MTDTLTFPAPAFANLIAHKPATTIEVIENIPPGLDHEVILEMLNDGICPICHGTAEKDGNERETEEWEACDECNEGETDVFPKPHREGDTVRVQSTDLTKKVSPWTDPQATVVSVTAKLERDVTYEEWMQTGIQGDTAPFGKGYVWVTVLELKE